jgi:hypothetical protein
MGQATIGQVLLLTDPRDSKPTRAGASLRRAIGDQLKER